MSISIFTSESINKKIDILCKENKSKKDFSWHYKYLISSIYLQPYLNRHYEEDDFVPINLSILRSTISYHKAAEIVKDLVDSNIILTDGSWSAGNNSRGFKIAHKKDYKWNLSLVKDEKLSKKILDRRLKLLKDIKMKGFGYELSDYWFKQLEIDYKKAKKYLDNHFVSGEYKHERALMGIKMLWTKSFFSTVDDKGDRLHTNLTVLAKPFRQFLTIHGKSLWQSDIANSQPVFLYTILKDKSVISTEELLKYKSIVSSGKFYEFMAEKANFKDLDLNNYDDRSAFKKKIFGGVLFDKNRKVMSRWEKVFKQEFPEIFNFIVEFKKKNYKALAISLQKAESKFIFSVVELINKQLSKPIITTIHDCIITDEVNIHKVKNIMEFEFDKRFGITPSIKVEKI